MTILIVNLALTPLLAVLWWWWRRPGGGVLLAVVLALDAIWACALLAFSGWRDAGGFMDCWPSCTEGQDATRVILLGTPVLMAPIGLALLAGLLWTARPRSS